jgi:hypothetical protein
MKRKKNKKQGRERRNPNSTFPTNFDVGNRVRVKPGTTDPDFEDIPLDDWVGTVREVDPRSNPPTYLIEWDQHTLDQMHPVYPLSKRFCAEVPGLEVTGGVLPPELYEQ